MTTKIKTFGGNIGIGTTDPGDFNLNVNGSLKTNSLVVNGVTDAQVPIGLIAPWYGSLATIPSGWALCNGNSYPRTDGEGNIATPDLTDRFIRGANGDAPSPVATGTTGGSNNKTLAAANLAPHSHGVSVSQGNAPHSHNTNQVNPNHTHGGNSNTSQVPHDHENTGQTPVNHSHGQDSNYSNAPHGHGETGNSEALHSHLTNYSSVFHSHTVRDTYGNVSTNPGNLGYIGWENPTNDLSTYANAPHSHGRSNNTQSPHSHGATGNASGPHRHSTAQSNTPHSHDTQNSSAPHSHGTNATSAGHSHPVTAVQASHSHSASSNSTGQATVFSVLNKYHALFYIMKI